MTLFEIFALAGFALAIIAAIAIIAKPVEIGSFTLFALAAAAFAGFTGATIYADGIMPVITNHTANLWGTQVWWDLLFAVVLCLFLIAPRARKAGMSLPLWTLFVVATASIGLLAMAARLFWLETQTQASDRSPK